jgi:AbrB family looped-hinge helix DNA binding protein
VGTINNVGTFMNVGANSLVGKEMSEATAKIDEKGRIMIPKKIRKATKLKAGTCVNIKTKDHTLIIEPTESIAEKYCGIFKVEKWPENIEEFAAEATKKYWTTQNT